MTDRTRLLSDNGPGYVSRAFRDYLGMVGIKHILAAPFHPQTNGKLERYHQTIKQDVNQVPYEVPSDLEEAIATFVGYYNYAFTVNALALGCGALMLRRFTDARKRKQAIRVLQQAKAGSNCLESQEEWPATVGVRSHQGERCLSMELRITSSLRMQAVRANFFGLPAASSRW